MGIGGDYQYKLLVDEEKIMFSLKHTLYSLGCLLNMWFLKFSTYIIHTLVIHYTYTKKAFGVQKVFRVLRALPVQYTSRVQSARYTRRQKHASDTTGACLWKVWSITPEVLEHASGRSGACLWKAWSIALGGSEHCSWRLGAFLLEYKSMPFRGAKVCLLGVQKHACLDTKASRA